MRKFLPFILFLGLVVAIPTTVFISLYQTHYQNFASTSGVGNGFFNIISLPSPTPPSAVTTSIYYGVSTNNASDFSLLNTFEQDARKQVSMIQTYSGWETSNNTKVPFNSFLLNKIRSHGSIPIVVWESIQDCTPINWNDTHCLNQPKFRLSNIITGNFDSYITQWAEDAKEWGHPFFLIFDPDLNGDWNAWNEGANGNIPGEEILTWRHVHDIFTKVGAKNVTWVWAISQEYNGSIPLPEIYPGDTYVDWVATNAYNVPPPSGFPSYQTFSRLISQAYIDLQKVAPSKPIMISEMGSPEIHDFLHSKANWITDALSVQLPNKFPKIKAITWVNQNILYDFRIESSKAAQDAFANAISSSVYATNNYSCLDTFPIPVPANVKPCPKTTVTPVPSLTPKPSSSPTPKPSSVPSGSPVPTPTVTSTPTPSLITPSPTPKPSVTPTPQPSNITPSPTTGTILNLTVFLHAIGKGGDNVNPNSGGNMNPIHTQRTVSIAVQNTSDSSITTNTGQVNFDSNSGSFAGSVDMGNLPSGIYLVKIGTVGFLTSQIQDVQSITAGQTNSIKPVYLVSGDIDGDNKLDIVDYGILVSCFGAKQNSQSCPDPVHSDLNDDGQVDGVDYNIFVRELSVQRGSQ